MTHDFQHCGGLNLLGLIPEKTVRAAGTGVNQGVVDAAIAFLKGQKAPTAEALVFLLEKISDPYGSVAGGIGENLIRCQPGENGPVIVEAIKGLMASSSGQAERALRVLVNLVSSDVKTEAGAALFRAFTSSDVPKIVVSNLQRYGIDDRLVLLSLGSNFGALETEALSILGRIVKSLSMPGSVLAPKSIEAHSLSSIPDICATLAKTDPHWASLLSSFLETVRASGSLQDSQQPEVNPKYATLSRALADNVGVQVQLAMLGVPAAFENLESRKNGDAGVQQVKECYSGLFRRCVERSDGYISGDRARTGEINSIVQFVVAISGREFWESFAKSALKDLVKSSLFIFCNRGQQSRLLSINKDIGDAIRLVRDSFQYVKCLEGGKRGRDAMRALKGALEALGSENITAVARYQDSLLAGIKEASDKAPRMTGFRLLRLCRELKVSEEELGRLAVTLFSYTRSSTLTLKAMHLAANPAEHRAIVDAISAYQERYDRSAPFAPGGFVPASRFSMLLPRLLFRLFE